MFPFKKKELQPFCFEHLSEMMPYGDSAKAETAVAYACSPVSIVRIAPGFGDHSCKTVWTGAVVGTPNSYSLVREWWSLSRSWPSSLQRPAGQRRGLPGAYLREHLLQ